MVKINNDPTAPEITFYNPYNKSVFFLWIFDLNIFYYKSNIYKGSNTSSCNLLGSRPLLTLFIYLFTYLLGFKMWNLVEYS